MAVRQHSSRRVYGNSPELSGLAVGPLAAGMLVANIPWGKQYLIALPTSVVSSLGNHTTSSKALSTRYQDKILLFI